MGPQRFENVLSSLRPPALSPIVQMQKRFSLETSKKAAAVDRWLQKIDSRVANAFRLAENNHPNFAEMIRGRVIDRRMNKWFEREFSNVPNASSDKAIPGSGSKLRPDALGKH